MSAREEVLARIRGALGAAPRTAVPRCPAPTARRASTPPGSPELIELLVDRLDRLPATVRPRRAATAMPSARGRRRPRRRAGPARSSSPPGLPAGWLPGAGVARRRRLDAARARRLDAVVTGCAVAIAETGTIVLDGAPDQGRRAITLVPDLHVCVVRADQVVADRARGARPARPHPARSPSSAGPSATSDIELDRVEGVHGPRTLVVVLAG